MTASEREALVEMVRAEAFIAPSGTEFVRRTSMGDKQILRTDDLRALCAEVERLTRERDEWVDRSLVLASESRVAVLTAEVERLREAMQKAGQSLADLSDTDAAYLGGWGGLVGTLSHRLLDAARTTGGRNA